MKLHSVRLLGILIAVVFSAPLGHANNHEYYRGKTIRIIVGLSAGAGHVVDDKAWIAGDMFPHMPG